MNESVSQDFSNYTNNRSIVIFRTKCRDLLISRVIHDLSLHLNKGAVFFDFMYF
jgi:hypothetical protein